MPQSTARAEFVQAAVDYLLGRRVPCDQSDAGPATTRRGGTARRDATHPTPGALGVRMVAELVGRSHAAPLFHFPDRLTLVAAVAAEGFRLLVGSLEDLPSGRRRGVQRVRDIALGYARWAGHAPALFATMYDPELAPVLEMMQLERDETRLLARIEERSGGDAQAAGKRLHAYEELLLAKTDALLVFVAAVEKGVEDGTLRGDVEPLQLAHALTSLADGLAWQRVTERQGSPGLLDHHAALTIDLMLEGMAAARREPG